MPAYVTETIIWTCVIAFMICVIAGLLVLTERWTPKNSATSKWLVGGVLVSAVGAVGGFASQQFKDGGAPQPPEVNESAPQSEGAPRPAPVTRQTPRRPVEPVPPKDESVPALPVPPAADVPEEVVAWAETELGARPVFDADVAYPVCVAALRAQDNVSRKEARNCRAELEQLHLTAIVGFYNLKRPYDGRLEDQEAALRERGISQDELARYNYVTAEMDRLNSDKSEVLPAVHDLESRLLRDIQSCRRSLCQSP